MNNIYYKIYAQGISELKKVGVIYQEDQIEPYVYSLDPKIHQEAFVISHNIERNEDDFYKKYDLREKRNVFEENKKMSSILKAIVRTAFAIVDFVIDFINYIFDLDIHLPKFK